MQRLFQDLRLLADDGSATTTTTTTTTTTITADCNHGLWNATTHGCDCASGWTTDWTNQDVLGGGVVYCNSQASTPAPGNSTAATTTASTTLISTTWIIVIVVVVAAVAIVLGVLCVCCCRRRRSRAIKKELQRKALEESEQQRHSQELQQRLQDDEAAWNREAMQRRQMWDSPMRWPPLSDATIGEMWEGSYTSLSGAMPESQVACRRVPQAFPLPTPRMDREAEAFAPFSDAHLVSRCTTPRMRYEVVRREPSSNEYETNSSAFTTTSDGYIYAGHSESPPPPLAYVAAASGTSPFTTPRHIDPYDPNHPF